ncbi:unnamed protein product [Tilletia controversa]|uniref:L-type lectin-like domain-containing protein n=3 Tax=Tilletia TaxID=13289 RepID=A0A8X7SXS3_9BASI|nr:hypothetical protein CF336_g2962 [Tilletia laevis]KAE8201172.1 hypothetical protein CF328_g2755 [Tilletia controversa]KAE8262561.1 hypothetical protein A4X03_0g2366 [Tilletia caries]KAE8206074.1 hypothetical protein CF335_g2088 [Tilletia laevis]KAE8248987.1 hypothetical protein A4X06_0g3437 [Tilletia controversa]
MRPTGLSARLLALATTLLPLLTPTPTCAQNNHDNERLGTDAVVPLRTHSIHAPYVDSNLQNKFWDFGADTIVDTNRAVRLTMDKPSQTGWLWSRLVLPPQNYEITVDFTIDGESSHLYGDGMAMWLTTERAHPGPVFGSKDYWTGLGIFFDTYSNTRHGYNFPRIGMMVNNGEKSYNVLNDGDGQFEASCSMDIRKAPVSTRAKLTHIIGVSLELEIQHEDWDEWETCFKVFNVTAPVNPYLGFTALTGAVSDNHDIVSVATNSLIFKHRTLDEFRDQRAKARESGGVKGKGRGKGISSGSSSNSKRPSPGRTNDHDYSHSGGSGGAGFFAFVWGLVQVFWMFFKWVLILGVIGGAVLVGLTYHRRQQAKRF